jgi:hypothetical protein
MPRFTTADPGHIGNTQYARKEARNQKRTLMTASRLGAGLVLLPAGPHLPAVSCPKQEPCNKVSNCLCHTMMMINLPLRISMDLGVLQVTLDPLQELLQPGHVPAQHPCKQRQANRIHSLQHIML